MRIETELPFPIDSTTIHDPKCLKDLLTNLLRPLPDMNMGRKLLRSGAKYALFRAMSFKPSTKTSLADLIEMDNATLQEFAPGMTPKKVQGFRDATQDVKERFIDQLTPQTV